MPWVVVRFPTASHVIVEPQPVANSYEETVSTSVGGAVAGTTETPPGCSRPARYLPASV